jgi:hypothetical protein
MGFQYDIYNVMIGDHIELVSHELSMVRVHQRTPVANGLDRGCFTSQNC